MALKHVILTILHQGPATGYDIVKEFDTVIEKEHFEGVIVEEIPPEERLAYMTLRRGILGEEAWLAWADELETVVATLG